MGFYKEFENEIKIFFVLLGLVILVGWFGALGSLSLMQNSSRQKEALQEAAMNTTEEGKSEVMQEEEKPAETVQEEKPVQYTNESVGVSFAYPFDWFVYDEAKWAQDNAIAPCETAGTIENTVIVSRKNLGRCVGVEAFNAWPGDLIISFSEKEWKNFPFVLRSEEHVNLVEIGGAPVAEYVFNENSLDTRKQAVRMYINTNQKGYIIEFTQSDLQGNYDPVFDEILASMQWL